MSAVRVAAAQTVEFRRDIDAALRCAADMAARAQAQGAALLCFPEGFLQGYLTDEEEARTHALDLGSPQFAAVLEHLRGPMIVIGLIEIADGRLYNTAVVVRDGVLVGRYRKAHLLGREKLFDAGTDSPVFEAAGLRTIEAAHEEIPFEGDIATAVAQLKLRAVSTFEHMTEAELDEGFARIDAALAAGTIEEKPTFGDFIVLERPNTDPP